MEIEKLQREKIKIFTKYLEKYKLLNDESINKIKKYLTLYKEKKNTYKVLGKNFVEGSARNNDKIINIIIENFQEFKNKLFLLDIKIIVKIIERSYIILDKKLFGYTIPNYKVIKKIKKLAENKCILEVGAGCGLWAGLLKKINVNIIPIDIKKCKTRYTQIYLCDNITALEKYNCEILMLIWPDIDDDMAYNTLKAFKNNIFIYIGESEGGACANDKFFDLLKRKWNLIYSEYIIAFWYDISDGKLNELNDEHKIYIYKRK